VFSKSKSAPFVKRQLISESRMKLEDKKRDYIEMSKTEINKVKVNVKVKFYCKSKFVNSANFFVNISLYFKTKYTLMGGLYFA